MALDEVTLKAYIDANISANGRNAVTGAVLNNVLRQMVESSFANIAAGAANISNANLAFDANHTVDMNSFTSSWSEVKQLKLNSNTTAPPAGEGTLHIQGYGTSAGTSVLSVANGSGTKSLDVRANGHVYALGNLGTELIFNPYFSNPSLSFGSAGVSMMGRGEIGSAHAVLKVDTLNTLTTSNCNLLELYNGGVLKVSVTKDGVMILHSAPTSSAGLGSGSLWCDTAAGNVIKMV